MLYSVLPIKNFRRDVGLEKEKNMSKVQLSVHKNYVPDWKAWEGIREIVQNAMDEHDKGNPIVVEHDVDEEELMIGNSGSELTIKHLLIGFTTKKDDPSSRGEKGEGLDLGILALIREGFGVEIETPTEVWTPEIRPSEDWGGEEVLFIDVKKRDNRIDGTYITIFNVSEDLWNSIKIRFLEFNKIEEESVIHDPFFGDLLLDPQYRGKIYVKGIYVQSDPEMKYGYNLEQVELDRDRRMISSFDLGWATARILSNAVLKRPEHMAKIVFNMLNNETKDVRGMCGANLNEKVSQLMAAMFEQEHGEAVVPVSSIKDSEDMESCGRKGVMAPRVLREIISTELDTPESVRKESSNTVLETYSWGDLDEKEQHVMKKVSKLIDEALSAFRGNNSLCRTLQCHELYGTEAKSILENTVIVKFRDDNIVGQCNTKTGEIFLSRETLSNYFVCLKTAIHELGHRISKSSDSSVTNAYTVESLWIAIEYIRSSNIDN